MSEQCLRLRIVTILDDRCTAVPLQVQDNDKDVRGAWQCQSTVKS